MHYIYLRCCEWAVDLCLKWRADVLVMVMSCAASSKPSPAQSRMTNVKDKPFLLVYWLCCFDWAKKSLSPLQPHRRTIQGCWCSCQWADSHHLQQGQPGNGVGFTLKFFTGFPSWRRRGAGLLLRSASLLAPFLLWPQLILGDKQAALSTAKCKIHLCPWGCEGHGEDAAAEGCASIMSGSDEQRETSGEFLLGIPPLPQPPQSCWSRDPPWPLAVLVAPYLAQYPQLRVHSPQMAPSTSAGWIWAIWTWWWPLGGGMFPQTWLSPCFSLFTDHIHHDRNVQTAWTMHCVRQVK